MLYIRLIRFLRSKKASFLVSTKTWDDDVVVVNIASDKHPGIRMITVLCGKTSYTSIHEARINATIVNMEFYNIGNPIVTNLECPWCSKQLTKIVERFVWNWKRKEWLFGKQDA